MKRKIALLLAVVMAVGTIANLTACKKTDEGSDPSATEPSDLLTQAPTETTPSDAESNEDYKNDIAYYPFPLLDMTYEEIMNKYPDAVIKGGPQGTVELTCEELPGITVIFWLNSENAYDKIENPVPSDLKPHNVESAGKVYPEIYVGKKYSEIDFEKIPHHELIVGNGQDIVTFIIYEKIKV